MVVSSAHFQGDSAVVSLMHVPVPVKLEVNANTGFSGSLLSFSRISSDIACA